LKAGENMPDDRGNGGIKVMDHREPPRITSGDRSIEGTATHQANGPLRSHRVDASTKLRKFDISRGLFAVVASLVIIASLFWAKHTSIDWLTKQPQYQIAFRSIQLVNEAGETAEPPRWYHGGTSAFLENVRTFSHQPEAVAVLQTTSDRLSQVFKSYPWIEDVVRVEYGPGSIKVKLRFRKPVAWVQLRGIEQKQIMVDQEATILPSKDIDVSALGRVIKIFGDQQSGGLAPPSDHRDGVRWKSRRDGNNLDVVDERIQAAAILAAFLVSGERPREAEKCDALRIIGISVSSFHPSIERGNHRRGGLFASNAEDTWIYWGDAPGSEQSEALKAEEKWAILREWALTTEARFLEQGDYWEFANDRLRFVCAHQDRPHRPISSAGRIPRKLHVE
jgi:hypothetical protein